jgi:hypothetical protein
MQLSATVEGMDITDRQATGTARAIHLTVNDRETSWIDPPEARAESRRSRARATARSA